MRVRRLAALVTLCCAAAFGQARINSGDLTGKITDPTGASIAKATVTATDPQRGLSRRTVSDAAGDYRLPLLPPGAYRVRVEAPGFSTRIVDNVEIRVGDTVSLPVEMTLGQITTELTVLVDSPVVEPERTQQSATLENRHIANLPINRRNYLDFALMTPGVVETNDLVDGTDYRVTQTPHSGLSFGGSNGRGNMFAIDGAENYSNGGGVRPSISQEAVAEFQVNRNSFSAEFGGAFGGAVNVVSKSGTNEWHGNLFGFLRHSAIQARNYFDPGKASFTRSQAGATLGGPVVRGRTFAFAALERLDRQESSFVPILQDRSAFTRMTPSQQQLADFFLASGNPQLRGLAAAMQQNLVTTNFPRTLELFSRNSGNFPFGEDTTQFSARLDHRFSDQHQSFLRANLTKGFSQNAQLGALLAFNRGRNVDQWDGTVMASHTWTLGPRAVSETRAMFGQYSLDVGTIDPFGPQTDITGYGLFGREIFLPAKNIERHWQLIQNFSHFPGNHNFKFGAEINPVRTNVRSETFFSGRFSFGENVPLGQLFNAVTGDPNFTTGLAAMLAQAGQQRLVPNLQAPISALQAYNLGYPTFYQQGFGDPDWIGWSKRYNFFAQDTWRIHPRLTFSAGVRYDLEVNEKIVGTDANNFAPRVGLAWTVTGDGKTVLRTGFGLFYSQVNLQIPNVAETLAGEQIAQVFVPLTGVPGLVNPMTGRPLTSADIYQRLLGQGVIGKRSIQAGDLLQFGVRPSPTNPFAVIFGIVDDFVNPYAHQASFEIERAVGSVSLSAAYNFNRGAHIVRILDRNLYYGPRRADGQPTFGFYNPLIFQKNIFESTSSSFYHALVLQAQKRYSRRFAMNLHYTFSKAMDETLDFNTDFQPHDQLNARADRALSSFHQAHRLVGSAVTDLPGGLVLSPVLQANSGRPFNLLAGVDNLGDRHPTTHRPLGAGRNIGRGPAYFAVDLRLSKKFYLGSEQRSVEFIAEGFNLLNRTNFKSVNNTVGNITVDQLPAALEGVRGAPTSPFSFTSAFDPRQFQLGVKVHY